MVGAFIGYLVADVVSGVLHWSVDNYGNGDTPVWGTVIEAFQGHHGEAGRAGRQGREAGTEGGRAEGGARGREVGGGGGGLNPRSIFPTK